MDFVNQSILLFEQRKRRRVLALINHCPSVRDSHSTPNWLSIYVSIEQKHQPESGTRSGRRPKFGSNSLFDIPSQKEISSSSSIELRSNVVSRLFSCLHEDTGARLLITLLFLYLFVRSTICIFCGWVFLGWLFALFLPLLRELVRLVFSYHLRRTVSYPVYGRY